MNRPILPMPSVHFGAPDDIGELPPVTVIMPIRNEARYIARSLGAVLAQDYPADQIEVLIVDGMSEDRTRAIVEQAARQSKVKVLILDNPSRIVPPALNIALHHSHGEIIIRVDGHCEIAPDYIHRCVAALHATGADCVGGPMVTVGETTVARAIALAQSSAFGVGGVAFRTVRNKPGFVDTLAFGAYRRKVFEQIGGFDEELVRNQDDEFNFRLTQAGGQIWLDLSIHSVYYSRASLTKLWQQYFEYGFYRVRVIQKRRAVASWRHLVPGLFVLCLAASLLLALVTRKLHWALSVATPYALANGLASVVHARDRLLMLPFLPLTFCVLHLAYGLGFIKGLMYWRRNESGRI
jgi:succinoglycan biosynthesis protein ExoA